MLPWRGGTGGTIRLELPVSYQNLLDGVIEFIVSNGHGDTQTVVPVAYSPNNDLYVSADQGGFEITNVHPGSDIYSELELNTNWGSTGLSLLTINVKPGPRLCGIDGMTSWPSETTVTHDNVSGDVEIYFGNNNVNAKVVVYDRYGVSSEIEAVDGAILIPAATLADAISRRTAIKLVVSEEVISEIIFLPEVESESFDEQGSLNSRGEPGESEIYHRTDYVDIYDVVDIVYSGTAQHGARCIAAYNEDRSFNRILLETGEYTNRHIEVDGTFRYVRACSLNSVQSELKLYFRTRG